MSTPIITAIVLNMQTALRAINGLNGYTNTFLSSSVLIDPENLATIPITETPMLVLGHRVEPVLRDFTGSRPNSIKERWRIVMEAVVDVSNDVDDHAKKLSDRFLLMQDVERALLVDPQRGGKALYTYVMQDTAYLDVANQNRLYLEIPVEVLVQRLYGTV